MVTPCNWSAGTPNTTIDRQMISGRPRKKSVYAAARARTGQYIGPRSVRATAVSVPSTSTTTPHTTKSRRFSHRPSRTFGNASRANDASKNVSFVRGQPGAPTTTRYSTTAVTSVESAATAADRRARRRRWRSRSILRGEGTYASCPSVVSPPGISPSAASSPDSSFVAVT